MRINKNTTITGKNVILVPYRKEHVEKYHEWMKSEELQQLTGSEPLSLQEEYAMQKSWLMDENKCTFIVLSKLKYEETKDEIASMVGDTNLFFANCDDRLCAEVEIMIAEEWARGQKCGWEATSLMLMYGITYLGVKQFIVKISYVNEISIRMFEKLGFVEVSRSHVFQEVTMVKIVDGGWIDWLRQNLGVWKVSEGSE
nr:N-acetyltransferase 9-like protein [Leptinotarsa decemlineata]